MNPRVALVLFAILTVAAGSSNPAPKAPPARVTQRVQTAGYSTATPSLSRSGSQEKNPAFSIVRAPSPNWSAPRPPARPAFFLGRSPSVRRMAPQAEPRPRVAANRAQPRLMLYGGINQEGIDAAD